MSHHPNKLAIAVGGGPPTRVAAAMCPLDIEVVGVLDGFRPLMRSGADRVRPLGHEVPTDYQVSFPPTP